MEDYRTNDFVVIKFYEDTKTHTVRVATIKVHKNGSLYLLSTDKNLDEHWLKIKQ